MAIELRQLRIFVTAAEELHFGRTAERLFLPQSVVSEQIKRLERSLGVVLFDRTRRSVQLSVAGAALLPHARRVLETEIAFEAAAASLNNKPTVLTLGVGRGYGRRLPAILQHLAHEGITLQTIPLTPAERTRQVEEGKIDAALLRGRVRTHAVETTHIWDEELVAAMPVTHPLAGRNTVSLEELAQSPVSLADRRTNPALHDLIEGALASRGLAGNAGIPFTTVEATFAQLATHPVAMWTPVFTGYEAEHSYAGIRTVRIDPPLTLPAFLITAKTLAQRDRNRLVEACRGSDNR